MSFYSQASEIDLSRDEVQLLSRTENDFTEMVYQLTLPVALAILQCMRKKCADITDTHDDYTESLKQNLAGIQQWNRLTVEEITEEGDHIAKELCLYVSKIARVKAMILHKNGFVEDAAVDISPDYATVMHAILMYAAVALLKDVHVCFSDTSMETCLRENSCIEKALIRVTKGALKHTMRPKRKKHLVNPASFVAAEQDDTTLTLAADVEQVAPPPPPAAPVQAGELTVVQAPVAESFGEESSVAGDPLLPGDDVVTVYKADAMEAGTESAHEQADVSSIPLTEEALQALQNDLNANTDAPAGVYMQQADERQYANSVQHQQDRSIQYRSRGRSTPSSELASFLLKDL